MKATSLAFLVVLALINCQGIKGHAGYEVDCSTFSGRQVGDSFACPRLYLPLCGTNGETYGNECELCAAKLKDSTISIKHKLSCSIEGKKLDCEQFKQSLFCTMEYRPHCGSDGISYSNKCGYCNAQNKNSELALLFEDHCYYGKTYAD